MKKILPSILLRFHHVYSLIFCLVAICNSSIGQVKFTAVASGKQISKNDYLQVQFVVENASNIEQIVPPSFKNFLVVSGPNQQSGMSNINGNVKQYIALEYILKPQRPGNFTLDPATAKADGN